MARNTESGIRYVCGFCATSDGRPIVHAMPSKTGGPCKLCDTYIERGEWTYVLDSGKRKGKPAPQTIKPRLPERYWQRLREEALQRFGEEYREQIDEYIKKEKAS